MALVQRDIEEDSGRIAYVKQIVQKRACDMEMFPTMLPTPLATGLSWKELPFSFPDRTIRLATMFSGIGAIEHAFQRLKL